MSFSDHLFSFTGRSARRHYWAAQGIVFLLAIAQQVIAALLPADNPNVLAALGILIAVLAILVLIVWINAATTIKRFHDRGKSGWWFLIGFVPLIGWVWVLIECGCLSGDESGNIYGPAV